jgi:hypothetical protein
LNCFSIIWLHDGMAAVVQLWYKSRSLAKV